MTHPENQKNISKILSVAMIGAFCVCFLLLGLYLVLIRNTQTHTRWQTESAISYITLATRQKDPQAAQAHIKAAHRNIVSALHVSPYDPYLWIRLARIEKLLETGDAGQIKHALKIAIQLKPSLRAQIQRERLGKDE